MPTLPKPGRPKRAPLLLRPLPSVILGVLLLYACAAQVGFRFRHPWMTETELLLHFGDALLMRDFAKPDAGR